MSCDTKGKCDNNAAFDILTKYIGFMNKPENEGKKSINMTVPVTTTPEKIPMTAPVVRTDG